MLLTGKAKEDFLNWLENYTAGFIEYTNTSINFLTLNSKIQNAIIIQWLDSIGIYILPQLWEYTMTWNYRISDKYASDFEYVSRNEATKQAILKANEIYNNK